MAEQAHWRAEARLDKELDYEFADRRLGMYLGFAALALFVIAGTVTIALGNPAIGGVIMTAGVITAVASTFVHGRKAATKSESVQLEKSVENKSDTPDDS